MSSSGLYTATVTSPLVRSFTTTSQCGNLRLRNSAASMARSLRSRCERGLPSMEISNRAAVTTVRLACQCHGGCARKSHPGVLPAARTVALLGLPAQAADAVEKLDVADRGFSHGSDLTRMVAPAPWRGEA